MWFNSINVRFSFGLDLILKNNIYTKRNISRGILFGVSVFFVICLFQWLSAKGRRWFTFSRDVYIQQFAHLSMSLSLSRLIPIVQGWQIVQSNTLHVAKNLKGGQCYFNKASSSTSSLSHTLWKVLPLFGV